jgi:hypothetical protein
MMWRGYSRHQAFLSGFLGLGVRYLVSAVSLGGGLGLGLGLGVGLGRSGVGRPGAGRSGVLCAKVASTADLAMASRKHSGILSMKA